MVCSFPSVHCNATISVFKHFFSYVYKKHIIHQMQNQVVILGVCAFVRERERYEKSEKTKMNSK